MTYVYLFNKYNELGIFNLNENELKTEKRYPYSKPIDKLELNEAIELMIKEQKHSISTLIRIRKY